jgi:hypothetical protein
MAKIRKELKIETTGMRKAVKEVPAKVGKARRLGVTFVLASNLCIVWFSNNE